MNKYNNSKIYKLYSESAGLTYIGSTCEKYLSRRLSGHVRSYKCYLNGKYHYVSSFEILKYDDYKIELIEKVNVGDKDELRMIEGKYIKEIECVNKRIAGRTDKQYQKEYYEQNKAKMNKYTKEYDEKNKQYRHTKIECDICGSYVSRQNIPKHKKTKKCLKHK